jgi:hypothetical protein
MSSPNIIGIAARQQRVNGLRTILYIFPALVAVNAFAAEPARAFREFLSSAQEAQPSSFGNPLWRVSAVLVNRCRFIALTAIAWSGLVAPSSISMAAGIREREPESMPWNVHTLDYGDTLEALRKSAKPDLAWMDRDDSGQETPIFLWIMQSPDRSRVSFTFDSPHWVKRVDDPIKSNAASKPFWCLLNPEDLRTHKWKDKVSEFLKQQFIRDRVDFPQENFPDGNQSYVELLAENERGARVFELVYSSTMGDRAHQELMKTYLLYASPDGKYSQASEDLGHQGAYPHGGESRYDRFEFNVEWKRATDNPPFAVSVRHAVGLAPASADSGDHEYEYYREGKLAGAMPLHLELRPEHYVTSDGELTLARLAEALAFYHSDWQDSRWVEAAERAKVKAEVLCAWLTELRRLNPRFSPEEILPRGRRVFSVPDEYKFDEALRRKLIPKSFLHS